MSPAGTPQKLRNMNDAQREMIDNLRGGPSNGSKPPSNPGSRRNSAAPSPMNVRRGANSSVSPCNMRRASADGGSSVSPNAALRRHSADPSVSPSNMRMALNGSDAGLNSSGLVFEAHQVFTFADRDRSGTMERNELDFVKNIVASLPDDLIPHPLTKELAESSMTWEAIDSDGNGSIDRAEWIEYVTSQAHRHGERPMLKLMQLLGKRINDMWLPGM